MGGDVARNGRYQVREVGGRLLATWHAEDGWVDSGWIREINTSFSSVYVQVYFFENETSLPIEMRIINHAPNTAYGWVSNGMCHAIEVAWLD